MIAVQIWCIHVNQQQKLISCCRALLYLIPLTFLYHFKIPTH